jgi:pimeloyl-ACP methyl ester carboxylesterase
LALHGWLDNAASFERLAPMLDGCFVVAPDLIGHGRSGHRRHDSGYYLWEHAEDMLAVTDSLGLAQFHAGPWDGHRYSVAAGGHDQWHCQHDLPRRHGAPFTVAEDDRVQHLARAYRLKRMVQRSQLPGFAEPDVGRFDDLDTALAQRRERLDTELSEGAARLLALRDLLQLDDGYCWRHDPRLVLPEPMPLTEREACDLLSQIRCPLYLLFGRQGHSPARPLPGVRPPCPARRRSPGTQAGTTSTWMRRTGRWSTNCCVS